MNDLNQISKSNLDDVARAQSIGENILTLTRKGVTLSEIFETTGEFLAANEAGGDIETANVYLINWGRATAVGTQTKIGR